MTKLIFIGALILAVSCMVRAEEAQTVREAFPNLSSGALASAKLAVMPSGVILQSGTLAVRQKDLDAEIRKNPKDIWPQLKRNLFFVLESKAQQELLLEEAKSWAKTSGEVAGGDRKMLMRRYLQNLVAGVTVTDAEAKDFYEKNKSMMGGAAFDKVKEQIRSFVADEKRRAVIDKHMDTISERTAVVIDRAWTTKQYAAAMDNPVDKARAAGQPLLVDFGADGCKPCEMMTPILDSLTKKYAGKLKVLFVHVRKEPVLASRFGIQMIPVQVFFDRSGSEFFRHVGFFAQDQIEAKLAEMGVN